MSTFFKSPAIWQLEAQTCSAAADMLAHSVQTTDAKNSGLENVGIIILQQIEN